MFVPSGGKLKHFLSPPGGGGGGGGGAEAWQVPFSGASLRTALAISVGHNDGIV